MCNACKMNGMGKKKHRIGGVGKSDAVDAGILLLGVGTGAIAAQEGKNYAIPMLYAATDTAEQKASKQMWANVGTGALGVGLAIGGVMLMEKEREVGMGLLGTGAGIATQCVLSWWVNSGTTPGKLSASKKWDNKTWLSLKEQAKSRVNGTDNASSGVMGRHRIGGADNTSSGIMSTNYPGMTKLDEIGRKYKIGSRRRMGTCSM